jgi:hypothetical protein
MTELIARALTELDQSTDALVTADPEDLAALANAVVSRANAITKITFLLDEGEPPSAEIRDRIVGALAAGDKASRHIVKLRQQTAEEWSRLARIRTEACEPERPHRQINVSA